ncbi:hypothetical protein I7I48_07092 [Histoplasma ohiense]|nr:hypothetical protein I7I48_07092 [Histoplasma ohiense (nom. inval.)]
MDNYFISVALFSIPLSVKERNWSLWNHPFCQSTISFTRTKELWIICLYSLHCSTLCILSLKMKFSVLHEKIIM